MTAPTPPNRNLRAEFTRRTDGTFAWRILAANNRIIGTDGGQGYEHFQDALADMLLVTGGGIDYDPDPPA